MSERSMNEEEHYALFSGGHDSLVGTHKPMTTACPLCGGPSYGPISVFKTRRLGCEDDGCLVDYFRTEGMR